MAIVNYPNQRNVGDAALWLGLRDSLRRIGVPVGYECDWRAYSPHRLRSNTARGSTVLITGGGNFGDLWRNTQNVREQVLQDFPDRRIIQLQQSIWFEDEANLQRMKKLCEAHPDFTLIVREQQSYELAQHHFEVPTILSPDLAFALGPLPRAAPECPILWLARTDKESRWGDQDIQSPTVTRLDWLRRVPKDPEEGFEGSLARRVNAFTTKRLQSRAPGDSVSVRLAKLTHLPLARQVLYRGREILSRGETVITDRLHGHILCLLLSIPHVVMDNTYGKIRSTFDTWTATSGCAHWANSPAEAIELATALLGARES